MTLPSPKRIESIDLLKGFVMVMMALDHTRDFFFHPAEISTFTDPGQAPAAVFFTRWVTHFCAPAFSFLAGISAFMLGRKKTRAELSSFLLKRGLWLVFIELTVINFAWYFDVHIRNLDIAVIWSLGISMIVLAGVIHLRPAVILIFSCIVIFGHNLLDSVHFKGNIAWSLLHEYSDYQLTGSLKLNIAYPIIPWIAVMSLGYYFGSFYDMSVTQEKRKKIFNIIGISILAFFILLRLTNLYGDMVPWKMYDHPAQPLMSFLSVTKYPPSLLYLAMTLSFTLLFLANAEDWRGKVVSFFTVFGRVPFFYYILHLYVIHVAAMIAAGCMGYGWDVMIQTNFVYDFKGFGLSLGAVYLVWIGVIFVLHPVCRMFDAYKTSNRQKWWLSYL